MSGRRLRIVHVIAGPYPAHGGSQLFVRAVSEQLAARGHEVFVFAPAATGGPPAPRAVVNGVTVRRFDTDRMTPVGERLERLPGWYRFQRAITGGPAPSDLRGVSPAAVLAALRLAPDVVATVDGAAPGFTWQFIPARRLRRFRLVGVPLFHTETTAWNAWTRADYIETFLGACDGLLALTPHERDFMAARAPSPRRIAVVGAGVDPDAFATADGEAFRRRHGIGAVPLVGYVGRIHAGKGIETLIRSMATVWRTVGDAHLLLAGAPSSDARTEAVLAAALDRLPPDRRARVICVGNFPEHDKPSVFDALDVFAMPSVVDSFGIVFLEAWLRGKPVVGARTAAVADVVTDHRDGRLVAPGDPEALGKALVELLTDPSLRARLGEAGRTKVVGGLTWHHVADRVEALYRDVTAVR